MYISAIGTKDGEQYVGSDAADFILGSWFADILTGLAGDDTFVSSSWFGSVTCDLNGHYQSFSGDSVRGDGAPDTMLGGLGNDLYVVGNAADTVIEHADEGADAVYSTVGWTLGDNVEDLVLTGSAAVDGTGNTQDNRLFGNGADNVLDGRGGYDFLAGGGGNDTYVFGRGHMDVVEDMDCTPGNVDTVRVEAGLSPADIGVADAAEIGGLYLYVRGETPFDGNADYMLICFCQLFESNVVEQVKFADGTVWDAATLSAMAADPPPVESVLVGTPGQA